MVDIYMDSTASSKKKLIVPLIVVLLCAVSLTGAGYAYNSNINIIDDDYKYTGLAMSLKGTDGKDVSAGLINIEFATASVNTNGYAYDYAQGKVFFDDGSHGVIPADKKPVTMVQLKAIENADGKGIKTGYYNNVYSITNSGKTETPVGYVDLTDKDMTKAADVRSVGTKLGTYTLHLDNHSGKDAEIIIKLSDKIDTSVAKAISGAYLVVTGTVMDDKTVEGGRAVSKVIDLTQDSIKSGVSIDVLKYVKETKGSQASYSVEVFVILSDYYSEDAESAEGSQTFSVNFDAKPVVQS